MSELFNCSRHDEYLKLRLEGPQIPRGYKSQFAEALRIQPAFLSQVLARKYALSLEQADLANQFWGHSDEESQFFLLLVSRDRSGSASLKRHFDQQLQSSLKKRTLVIERLGKRHTISEEATSIYYSSWIYSAIHVACTIKELQTRTALSERLKLPLDLVNRVLGFLVENKLLEKKGERYQPSQKWLRLDKSSAHISKHHSNWRQKVVQNIELQTDADLHYSGIYSLSAKSAEKIHDRFLEFLKQQVKEIEQSPEEDLFCICTDFFRLK